MTPQQKAGRTSTQAKAAAARENGKRGGRPTKTLTIRRVKARADYTLSLTLSDGRTIERSLVSLVERARGLLLKLRKPAFFMKAKVVDGAVTWPGEIDLDPCHMIYGPDWPVRRRVPTHMEL